VLATGEVNSDYRPAAAGVSVKSRRMAEDARGSADEITSEV